MSEHAQLPTAFLAMVDQMRAETEDEVRREVEFFREHADSCHGGDPVCADALTTLRIMQRGPMYSGNIAGGAIGLIIKLQREVAELRAELGR